MLNSLQNRDELSLEEINSFILKLEAQKRKGLKEKERDQSLANMAQFRGRRKFARGSAYWQKGPHANCYRCAKSGHQSFECTLDPGLQFCYTCREITTHESNSCPNTQQNNTNTKTYQSNNGYGFTRGHPRGRSNFRGRNNFRGRGSFQRGYHQGQGQSRGRGYHHRTRPYPRGYGKQHQPTANLAGNDFEVPNFDENISFIADSGATHHIINNKALVFDKLEKCPGEVIKSANKNACADITIDGKGNLMLNSNLDDNKTIYLTNVIVASEVAHNLISLRRFAEAGLGIYLDDKTLNILIK